MKNGACVKSRYGSYRNNDLETMCFPIQLAAERLKPDIVEHLMKIDPNYNELIQSKKNSTYILHRVFSENISTEEREEKERISIAKILLDKGIDIDKVDPQGKRAINYALYFEFWEAALFLLCQHWNKSLESFCAAVKGALMGTDDKHVTRRKNVIKTMEKEAGKQILRREFRAIHGNSHLEARCTSSKRRKFYGEQLSEGIQCSLFEKINELYLEKLQEKNKPATVLEPAFDASCLGECCKSFGSQIITTSLNDSSFVENLEKINKAELKGEVFV